MRNDRLWMCQISFFIYITALGSQPEREGSGKKKEREGGRKGEKEKGGREGGKQGGKERGTHCFEDVFNLCPDKGA